MRTQSFEIPQPTGRRQVVHIRSAESHLTAMHNSMPVICSPMRRAMQPGAERPGVEWS